MSNIYFRGWKDKQVISTQRMNDLQKNIPRRILGGAGNLAKSINSNQIVLEATAQNYARSSGSTAKLFKVASFPVISTEDTEYCDYIICHSWNPLQEILNSKGESLNPKQYGVEGTQPVYVAKPYHLRMTPFKDTVIEYPLFTFDAYGTIISGTQRIQYIYELPGNTLGTIRYAQDLDTVYGEYQIVTPSYYIGEVILGGLGTIGGTGVRRKYRNIHNELITEAISWQDLNMTARCWGAY